MLTPSLISIGSSQKFLVDKPICVIGRSKERSDLHISDPHVSSVHCEISFDANVLTIKNKSRHGTMVNGKIVDEETLADGDVLTIAGHQFRVAMNPEISELTSQDWLIRMAGMELGPMRWDELEYMLRRGEVRSDDEVMAAGSNKWQSIASLMQNSQSIANRASQQPEGKPALESPIKDAPQFTFETADEALANDEPLSSEHEPDEIVFASDLDSDSTDEAASDEPPMPTFVGDTIGEGQSLAETTTDFQRNRSAAKSSSRVQPAELAFDATEDLEGDQLLESDSGKRRNKLDTLTSHSAPAADATSTNEFARRPPVASEMEFVQKEAEYFYRIGKIEDGPVSLAMLRQFVSSGSLSLLDEVREFGREWVRAVSVPNLFQVNMEPKAEPATELPGYDANLLDDVRGFDERSDADNSDSLPFGEPRARRVNFDQPASATPIRKSQRHTGARFKFSDWMPSVSGLARSRRSAVAVGVIVLAWLLWGMIPTYEGVNVFGTVTLDGVPIKQATISFFNLKTGRGATVPIGDDGKYEAVTLEGGLPEGIYKVSFMPQKPESQDVVKKLQRIFQRQQGFGDVSGMGSFGSDDRANDTTPEYKRDLFQLPPGTIPVKLRSIDTSELEREIKSSSEPVNFVLSSL